MYNRAEPSGWRDPRSRRAFRAGTRPEIDHPPPPTGLPVSQSTFPRSARVLFRAAACLSLAGCGGPTEPSVSIEEDRDTGRIRVMVPEAYELANVILALTSFGRNDPSTIRQEGSYYEAVQAWFDPSEPSLADLQLGGSDPLRQYYEFRENSAAYGFVEDRVVRGERFAILWQPNRFGDRLASVQAFADATDFRTFYEQQAPFYASLIARYRETAEVEAMIAWLEGQFGDEYDRYTVVLSPLVNGRHSATWQVTGLGSEGVVFVAGPDVDGGPSLSPAERSAIVQRILLTELDHLFVNPVSEVHEPAIRQAFVQRARWTSDPSSFYDTPLTVFNEYMTWAIFTLWLDEHAPEEEFESIVSRMEQQMEARLFTHFEAFNRALLELWREAGEDARVVDLYPAIIDWAATQ